MDNGPGLPPQKPERRLLKKRLRELVEKIRSPVDLPLPQTTTQYKQPLHRIIDHSPGMAAWGKGDIMPSTTVARKALMIHRLIAEVDL